MTEKGGKDNINWDKVNSQAEIAKKIIDSENKGKTHSEIVKDYLDEKYGPPPKKGK